MKRCTIIGIADNREQWFAPEVMQAIQGGRVFSGGLRHKEIMQGYLPEGAVWIDITVPVAGVLERYRQHEEVVVFASGDPLFYGFAATVQRECPGVEMKVMPTFNSLQMLAHRMLLPYQDMRMVSQTGRPWMPLDVALIEGERLIGVLTDRRKTPQVIAQRMVEYGYVNYRVTVGECLGNEARERVVSYDSVEALAAECVEFAVPNCMIMQQKEDRARRFGIPESEFFLLNGRTKMITKMPVRLVSLAMLELGRRKCFWDVGFCTGSVSIEAKLQCPRLEITSFEVREEGQKLMAINSRRFGAPGINAVIGDFLETDVAPYGNPDAVFIGGHGGRLKEMVEKLAGVMSKDGCVVFNSVSDESRCAFEMAVKRVGMMMTGTTCVKVDDNNAIWVMRAERMR